MDDKSFTIRVPKRWVRLGMIVTVMALIVAPLTAIASHSFTDVTDSNTFHADIAWMKGAEVTKGCNPPANTLYCPNNDVTRGQMAAFMRRFAQYIGAEDGETDLVNSGEANSVTPAMTTAEAGVVQVSSGSFPQLDGTVQDIDSITINAPAAGYAIVTLTSEAWMHHANGTTTELQLGVSASSSSFADGEDHDVQTPSAAPTGSYVHTVGITKAFPVTAGNNTFHFLAERVSGAGGNSQVGDYQITATYVSSAYGTVEQTSTSNDASDGD